MSFLSKLLRKHNEQIKPNQPSKAEIGKASNIINDYCRKIREEDGNDYYNRSREWFDPSEICWNIDSVNGVRYYIFYFKIPSDEYIGYEVGEELFRVPY